MSCPIPKRLNSIKRKGEIWKAPNPNVKVCKGVEKEQKQVLRPLRSSSRSGCHDVRAPSTILSPRPTVVDALTDRVELCGARGCLLGCQHRFEECSAQKMCVASACYKKRSGDPWTAPCGSAGTAQQGHSGTQSQSVSITLNLSQRTSFWIIITSMSLSFPPSLFTF
jgi:hypothetical protein